MKKKQNTLDDSEVAEKLKAIEALPAWHKRKKRRHA
jgi:hypothetical protein|nr:MAG TPA: hypothetical protein [Caudoviricetes sp.]